MANSMSGTAEKPTIALIGTLDTKQEEFQYAVRWLEQKECRVYMLDVSTRPSSGAFEVGQDTTLLRPHVLVASTEEVCTEGDDLFAWDRARLREVLRQACQTRLASLLSQGCLDAIASFGGSQNTSFATAVMRASDFPIGLPKFVLSTMASGDVSQYVGESDIAIMPSIGDISGSLNAITRLTLRTALAAIHGMAQEHVRAQRLPSTVSASQQKPMIGISMFGVTTPAVTQISHILTQRGFQPVAFHATGSGGKTLERLIRQGFFKAVIDLTTTELCDQAFGGVLSAGHDRCTAAAACGVPQIVSVGAMDMINFGPISTLPPRFQPLPDQFQGVHICVDGTKIYQHNSEVTLVRVTPEQSTYLGEYLVTNIVRGIRQAMAANNGAINKEGPVRILLPQQGISAMDAPDGLWNDPIAREHLFSSIENQLRQHQFSSWPTITVEQHNFHINSPQFAQIVATQAIELAQLQPDSAAAPKVAP